MMKNLVKKVSAALIVCCLVLSLLPFAGALRVSAAEGENIASGTNGTCTWVIDAEGVLTIAPADGSSGTLKALRDSAFWNWYDNRSDITAVVVKPGVSVSGDASYMFYTLNNCTAMDLSNLDTSAVTSMADMFNGCSVLTELDLSGWDTSGVTDMSSMFGSCNALTELDLSHFDTSGVTSMHWMFAHSEKLTAIDVTGWDTSKVTDMAYMFYDCEALADIDVSGFDTSAVTTMYQMFAFCRRITELDLTGWDVSSVTNMGYMFDSCNTLAYLDISTWDTSSVSNMENFIRLSGLRTLKLGTGWVPAANYSADYNNYFNVSDGTLQYSPMAGYGVLSVTIHDGDKDIEVDLDAYPESYPGFTGDMTATIVYHPLITVKFVDGNSVVDTQVLFAGLEAPTDPWADPADIPVRKGKHFVGWYKELVPYDKDTTISANWDWDIYDVVYMVEGEVYASFEVEFADKIPTVDAPVKEPVDGNEYIFAGWLMEGSSPDGTAHSDITFTAVFVKAEDALRVSMTTELPAGSPLDLMFDFRTESGYVGSLVFIDWGDGKLVPYSENGVTAGSEIKLYSAQPLAVLLCDNNQLTSLDIINCPGFYGLSCVNNKLTELDLTDFDQLMILLCSNNRLTELDVSACPELFNLYCSSNQLSGLDVSACTGLVELMCENNSMKFSTMGFDIDVFDVCTYAPQAVVPIPEIIFVDTPVTDLSSEYMIGGKETVYTWYDCADDSVVVPATAENGVFTFGEEHENKYLYCTMTNETYPDLVLRTTETQLYPSKPLDAPTLTAYTYGYTSIKMTWTAVDQAEGYEVFRCDKAGEPYFYIDEVDANTTEYRNIDLSTGYTYFYKVRAYKILPNGERFYGDMSNYATARPLPATPVATAVRTSANTATVSWVQIYGATGYSVYRSAEENGEYIFVCNITSGDITTYEATELASTKTYYYKVRAFRQMDDEMMFGNYSNVAAAYGAPGVTTVTARGVGYTSAKVLWEPVERADGYAIYRCDVAGGAYSYIATVGKDVTEYTNTGLTTGITYYYKVRAFTETENGGKLYGNYSLCATARPLPATPVLVLENSTPEEVTFSWAKIYGATGYSIYRSTEIDGTYTFLAGIADGNTYTYTDTTAKAGQTYYYKIRAYRAVGEEMMFGEYSLPLTAVVAEPPVAPVLTARSVGYTSAKVLWEPVDGVDGYEIYRCDVAGGEYSLIITVGKDVTEYTNTGLSTGTTYYYKVRAFADTESGKLYSNYSACATARPLPASPVLKLESAEAGAVSFSWAKIYGATGYSVYRSTEPDGTFAFLGGITDGATTTFTDTTASAGTTYYYKVRAYRAVGEERMFGDYSKPLTVVAADAAAAE